MGNEELVQLIKQGVNPAGNMEQLYIQNQGIIFSVVKKYRYACQADYNSTPIIELDELMHEAYFGLVKAIENYDASQGVLFMSYAPYWIRQAVKRFLDDNGRVIRVPVHKQAQVYQYNRLTAHFLQNFNREPSIHEYARWLQISDKGVEQLKGELWDMVSQVLKHDTMIEILRLRFVDRFTLDEIGDRLDITRERVRQYEALALRRLRCNSRSKWLINYLVA